MDWGVGTGHRSTYASAFPVLPLRQRTDPKVRISDLSVSLVLVLEVEALAVLGPTEVVDRLRSRPTLNPADTPSVSIKFSLGT